MGIGQSSFVTESQIAEAIELVNRLPWRAAPPPPRPCRVVLTSRREIARQLGISGEQVRRIELVALAKCRIWCEAHGYDLEAMLR